MTVADDGQQAVNLLAADEGYGRFDVVLMDIQMPVMDGYAATQVIRQRLHLTEIPIIATTAHAMHEERLRCLASGMSEHVTKPINAGQLVKTILRLVVDTRSQTPGSGAILHREARADSSAEPGVKTRSGGVSGQAAGDLPDDDDWLDKEDALARLDGDEELYREMVELFVARHEADAARIRELLADGALPEANRVVHTLKGLAGTLGLKYLHAAAAELDAACKAREEDRMALLVPRVEDELRQAMRGLGHLYRSEDGSGS